ncbi:hypothetical protein HON36_02800 [Candidatus Parcubacteria bacterium]|jgi:hypothetical protein|nr:hypothetical protein [Candidatus Parcubacteria bacterium]MBT7228551.1 hypothetical protein [Candidatus Parcubacteria bacterium]
MLGQVIIGLVLFAVLYLVCWLAFGLRFFKKCSECNSRRTITHTVDDLVDIKVPNNHGENNVSMDITICHCGHHTHEKFVSKK